ncbi:phosphate acetyltransferase [bacterium]|nr:phosphate acetyltransferase [bacterium]
MDIMATFRKKAQQNPQKIVLPESEDKRTLQAAAELHKEKIVQPILLGNVDSITNKAHEFGINISGITIIDIQSSNLIDSYAEEYFKLREKKGISREAAREGIMDEVFFGSMMVRMGDADGCVSGATHTTAHTVRAALRTIGTKPGINTVSSCFIMVLPNTNIGIDGVVIFADCAVMPNPDENQLADIALSAADSARIFTGAEPRVAMLSFSTYGSAEHELVDKVRNATRIAQGKEPNLIIDGDLQFDAAIIPEISAKKAPGNKVGGKANVFIFPDLNAANIGYKITQRLAGAEAIGPFLQGLAKPANDLSRGCSASDIVSVSAITAVQAQALK